MPDPPLFRASRRARAAVDIFLDWFNRVWKRPPNEIDAERSKEARTRSASPRSAVS